MSHCAQCGDTLTGRADSVYCSPACKQRAYRNRQKPGASRNAPSWEDAEAVSMLRVFLRQIFTAKQISSYSPEAKTLMIRALRQSLIKLEKTP